MNISGAGMVLGMLIALCGYLFTNMTSWCRSGCEGPAVIIVGVLALVLGVGLANVAMSDRSDK